MAVLDYAGLRRYDGKIKQYTGDLVDTVVEVTDTQPVDLYNKIWVTPSEEDVELAEMSDIRGFVSSATIMTEQSDLVWAQGAYKSADGTSLNTETALATRIRSSLFGYDTSCGIKVVIPEGVNVAWFKYDKINGSYFGWSGWQSGTIEVYDDCKYKLTARYSNDANVSAEIVGPTISIYTFSSTDKTLTEADKSADAKIVGEFRDSISNRIDMLHGLIDYGYADVDASSGNITVSQRGSQFTCNLGVSHNTIYRIRVTGGMTVTSSQDVVDSWSTGIELIEGRTYQCTLRLVSGSAAGENLPSFSVYEIGTHNSIGTFERLDDKTGIREFVYANTPVNLVLYVNTYTILVDAVYQIIVKDITDSSESESGIISNYVTSLPEEYRQVEYLESDGRQFISLGVKANQDTRLVSRFQVDEVLSRTNNFLGGRRTSSTKALSFGVSSAGKYFLWYGDNAVTYYLADFDAGIHTVDINKNEFYFDGDLKASAPYAEFETYRNIALFGVRDSGGYNYGYAKIYEVQLYNDGVLAMDLRPCVRLSDSVSGMFDIANSVFYPLAESVSSAPLIQGDYTSIENAFKKAETMENDIRSLQDSVIEIPAYVVNEANRVADKVRNVQTGDSITFVACSDLHYAVAVGSSDEVTVANSQEALHDMRDAILAISEQLHIDFYACFGDAIYQWQSHGANYDNGVKEAIGVTKLLNESFGNNMQVRIVGNHDPNCENSNDKEFSAYMLNSFAGIYSNMLTKDEAQPYGGYGYHDFDFQKVRLIVLNTSFYTPVDDLTNGATRYFIGSEQAYWLCQALDLSQKDNASEWQIVICSHVGIDSDHSTIRKYTSILNAYETGGEWTESPYSYNFAEKNSAKLSLYINGHSHLYNVRNIKNITSGGTELNTLKMANLFVPNALPGRNGESIDGVVYEKTMETSESTAFQLMTLDPTNCIVYAHHYGAGIDIILHYESDSISVAKQYTTNLTSPVWSSNSTGVATVSDGLVTPVAVGNTTIWCKSSDDNCIEAWNINVNL